MRFLYRIFSGISIHMLGPEIPQISIDELISDEVDYLMQKWMHIVEYESMIKEDEPLYLFTWSPDPDEIPDSDFNTQHRFCLPFMADFLMVVSAGVACVESSQMGNPHYHGWYQVSTDPLKEKLRIVYTKVIKRFGNLKITKSKGHYKIGSLVKQANCLYYYKKDMLQSMATVESNPITGVPYEDVDWSTHWNLFTKKGRESVADIEDRINLKDFYKEFYANSL